MASLGQSTHGTGRPPPVIAPLQGSFGSVQSTANLINCLLGAGLVALPFCYMSSGVVLATLLMLVSHVACR